jgi:6-phosphogluconolactonase (cycloisomerase 2 family)
VTGLLTLVQTTAALSFPNPESVSCDPTGRFLYVASSDSGLFTPGVTLFSINLTTGLLTQVATYGQSLAGSTRGARPDPSGRFCYVNNQVANTIAVYSISATDGSLTAIAGSPFAGKGNHCLYVSISFAGNHLYTSNDLSNDLTAFSINPATGAIASIGANVAANGNGPWGSSVDPNDKYFWVVDTNTTTGNTAQFSINAATGALTVIAGTQATAGSPDGIAVLSIQK